MRRLRHSLTALAVLLGSTGVASAALTTVDRPADAPAATAISVDPPRPVVVIGDSAISALRWVPGADNAIIGFEHTLDLESCRRLLAPSCRGREGRTPPTVYEALDFHRDSYTRELQLDDTGQDVSALQTRLIRLGLLSTSATGLFGPATETAVRAFQRGVRITETGRADVATLDLLGFDTSGIQVP